MQDVYYIDSNFIKENSLEYILSIRYSTDGFSFCIHDPSNKLLVFYFQPLQLDSEETAIVKAKKIITEDAILNLKYKKVYVLSCNKEKILIPEQAFHKDSLADTYQLCFQLRKNDVLLYQKLNIAQSYMAQTLPRNFIQFLNDHYSSLSIVNSAYPFIIHSLSSILFNTHHLFIDIHNQYFDLLLTHSNDILLFNSFSYGSVTDIIYYVLNCLQQCNISKEHFQTTLSGNLVNNPTLVETISKYIPNISVLDYTPLSQQLKNKELNSSSYIHLLNIHKCE